MITFTIFLYIIIIIKKNKKYIFNLQGVLRYYLIKSNSKCMKI